MTVYPSLTGNRHWEYLSTGYTYEANGLLEILYQNPSATVEDILYEYEPNGNRTKQTRTNASLPLRGAVTSASYDDANEMQNFIPVAGSSKDLTYDENGNLLTVLNSCGTTTYIWDVRNRLVGITGYQPDCYALSASFVYDAVGRRIEKTVNGVTTQYLYDGLDIIQEKQNGNVTANYVRTLNIDEPLARVKSDGTVRHYVVDALGSVIALTDENGIVMTTYTYDPFGNVTVTGQATDNPFQYTGRENDGTGLYYYRARYYSPEFQRFISEDPIGIKGGINKFAYVGNNPVNFTDPFGLYWPIDCFSCFDTMNKINKAIDKCRKRAKDQCKNDEDEIKYMEQTGAAFYGADIWACVETETGIPNAYLYTTWNCWKCVFLFDPARLPTIPGRLPR